MFQETTRGEWVLGLATVLLLHPAAVEAQTAGVCELNVRGGIRPAFPHAVAEGSPIDDMRIGTTLGSGLACDLSNVLRVGVDAEWNRGGNMTLSHTLAGADVVVWSSSGGTTARVRIGAGRAWSKFGYDNNLLVEVVRGRAIEPGTDGLAIAAGFRLDRPLTRRLVILGDAGWRGSFLEETDFDRDEKRRKLVHVFPISVGIGVRF